MRSSPHRILSVLFAFTFVAASCGSGETAVEQSTDAITEATEADNIEALDSVPGVRLVSATDGAKIVDDPPEDLVILDVRTPEEFEAGHIEGAIMLDFYEPDFADKLAELDPDVPYLVYCHSGSRSGQTVAYMSQLDFADVADVEGGITAWNGAGLPTVTP